MMSWDNETVAMLPVAMCSVVGGVSCSSNDLIWGLFALLDLVPQLSDMTDCVMVPRGLS